MSARCHCTIAPVLDRVLDPVKDAPARCHLERPNEPLVGLCGARLIGVPAPLAPHCPECERLAEFWFGHRWR